MDYLEKDFNSEKNRIKREAYRANHTREQKVEVLEKWKLFMKEVKADYPFFEYFEKHFNWHKKNCVKSKLPSKPTPSPKVRHSKRKIEIPISPLPEVHVLKAHISSSSSNEPSSESEKEKEPLDDQLGDSPLPPPRIWKSKYRGNPAVKNFHREKIVSREYRRQKLEARGIYRKGNTLKLLKPKAKGKCFKCGKKGHIKKECPGKSPTHSLVSEDISKILELDHPESESPNSSIDREICQIYQDSSSPRIPDSTSSSSDETISCTNSCCRNYTVEVLSKQEELLLDLIEQIKDPEEKAQKLSEFHKTLVKETSTSKPRFQEPKVDLEKIYSRFTKSKKEVTIQDLQKEIKDNKVELRNLKQELTILRVDHGLIDLRVKNLEFTSQQGNEEGTSLQNPSDEEVDVTVNPTADMEPEPSNGSFLHTISRINFQKWHSKVRIVISKNFEFEVIALIDSGADLNCIQEGIIPSKYFRKTRERLTSASGGKMQIEFKIPNAHVCQDNTCFKTTFVLVKNMTDRVILGNPFMCLLYPFTTDSEGITTHPFGQPVKFKFLRSPKPKDINSLQEVSISKTLNLINAKTQHLKYLGNELSYKRTDEQLACKDYQSDIRKFEDILKQDVCSDLPTAFWHRKRHEVALPYVKDFHEKNIPTKARPIQMSQELMDTCKVEIEDLLKKGIIRNSRSPWSCPAFYVQKNAEIERGVPRLVINYKPLNKVLEWIRYPIPNKRDLVNRLSKAVVFSKFDMKSGFWQIQISESDRYKTAFTTPFGHYEWNVMPFGLKNAPSEFQNIMNEIFNPFSSHTIVYIDDVLIFSESLDKHWKHLRTFFQTIKKNGLVVSAPKIKLFQTSIRFLGFDIRHGVIKPIDRAIQFAEKFPDEILEKTQLQRFLGSLNYISDFYQNLRSTMQAPF
ncbi:uncharacterized protein LOC115950286 [Quercus lobata]|uniref:uncharacterized protein LOC115950286 n=1 Tax=Quercus lobata TaxID=97700 RepID=UPI001245EE48|nr:uncharacterized protein LOC115950286 [Quercus lobata]